MGTVIQGCSYESHKYVSIQGWEPFQGTLQTLPLLTQHQRDSRTRNSDSAITFYESAYKSSISLGRHPSILFSSPPTPCFCLRAMAI